VNSAAPHPIITLLTDFGTRDAYVGSLKGVILGLNPSAVLVDLSHEVPPQNIRAGALLLSAATPFFPLGTVHLAVVDPGVGSPRRALAARCRGCFWVGPDNGLFHLVFRQASDLTIISLDNSAFFRPRVSATFHGRDIFAPVAAHLSLGVDLLDLGTQITDPVPLDCPDPKFGPQAMRGEIMYIDQFGNLVSNIGMEALVGWVGEHNFKLKLGPLCLTGLASTYTDVAPGEFLALEGSHGFLEIACAMANAARRLQVEVGLAIEIIKD
jgi:S-adenosyl-L-methionine hydrolase (adenosine-forming)